ncbi:hypothetical protein VISI1226_10822 [Vibrio sinaloensis DSM 21326]|uniref:Uncharacterized protein n=1 Tax=Vibrio sinaloensis DSM 21326 TaxID=945550 RepID=E8MAY6_PHOS4|nr:hypothetical protein VISI1226_10822 [Vibrio sinaloensis DSM 21326]
MVAKIYGKQLKQVNQTSRNVSRELDKAEKGVNDLT